MQSLNEINESLMKDQNELRAKNNDLTNQINKLKTRSQD